MAIERKTIARTDGGAWYDGLGVKYVTERTCTILGSIFYDYDISDDAFWETELSCGHTEVTRYEVCEDMFCSQCGAKVVSE